MNALPYIDFDEVHARAPWLTLIDALEAAHRRDKPKTGQLRLWQSRDDGQPDFMTIAPAWEKDEALGVKLVTSFPKNMERHGVSTVGSIYIIFDPATGKPQTLIDGEALIFRKTAADTALGIRLLARPDAKKLVMMGAGALAPYVIEAALAVCPGIDEVQVWNRTMEKAEALASDLSGRGLPVVPCKDAAAAHAGADIILAATMAEEPIIRGGMLKPSTHVGLIGSFRPEMREGDDTLLTRAKLYVDDPSAIEKSGDFTQAIEAGIITREDVLGDLYDLCQGRCALPGPDDISMFKNAGASQLDLMTAQVITAHAIEG